MNITEIKKELYKKKPEASLRYIRKGVAYYYADLETVRVNFEIPVSDMGDADFTPRMDAKLLNRWIVPTED
jgi:hypothetical protein